MSYRNPHFINNTTTLCGESLALVQTAIQVLEVQVKLFGQDKDLSVDALAEALVWLDSNAIMGDWGSAVTKNTRRWARVSEGVVCAGAVSSASAHEWCYEAAFEVTWIAHLAICEDILASLDGPIEPAWQVQLLLDTPFDSRKISEHETSVRSALRRISRISQFEARKIEAQLELEARRLNELMDDQQDNVASRRDSRNANGRMSREEADAKLRAICSKLPPAEVANLTIRKIADLVGCSTGAVGQLPTYKRIKVDKRPKVRAINLSDKTLACVADSKSGNPAEDALSALIEDQKKDYEPNPLATTGKSPRIRKIV